MNSRSTNDVSTPSRRTTSDDSRWSVDGSTTGASTPGGTGVTNSGNDDVDSDTDSNMNAGGANGGNGINGAPSEDSSYGSASTIVDEGTQEGGQLSRQHVGPLAHPNDSLDQRPMSDSDRSTSTSGSDRSMRDSDLTASPATPNAQGRSLIE